MAKSATKREHNYIVKMRRMYQIGALPTDLGMHQLLVFHDDWCGIHRQKRCNCDPDIRPGWSQRVVMN
jgi:hypothetical protein